MKENAVDAKCVRNFWSAFLLQTILDVQDGTTFKRRHQRQVRELHRNDAIHYMKSKHFEMICDLLGHDPKMVRKAALK